MSYQKKEGPGHARPSFFWYDSDKGLKRFDSGDMRHPYSMDRFYFNVPNIIHFEDNTHLQLDEKEPAIMLGQIPRMADFSRAIIV